MGSGPLRRQEVSTSEEAAAHGVDLIFTGVWALGSQEGLEVIQTHVERNPDWSDENVREMVLS